MVYAGFDGREIVKALRSMGYRPSGREGSHVKLRYESPNTDEVRVVTVPLTDSDQISQNTPVDRRPVRGGGLRGVVRVDRRSSMSRDLSLDEFEERVDEIIERERDVLDRLDD